VHRFLYCSNFFFVVKPSAGRFEFCRFCVVVCPGCDRMQCREDLRDRGHFQSERERGRSESMFISRDRSGAVAQSCLVSAPATEPGCRFSSKTSCIFTLILQRAKVSKYHQSIKIRFSTQNIKISAVSTPIFARISPFFCIFRDLPEYFGENASKCQKMQKSFAPNFGNFQKISKKRSYFDTLAVFYTLVLCWIFAFSL